MKKEEYEKLGSDIFDRIVEKGLPVDVKHGSDEQAAAYILGIYQRYAKIDEPIGTSMGVDFEMCNACHRQVGSTAHYCKRCGAYLRQVM